MIQKYLQMKTIRNFSIVMLWVNGGSCLDGEGKKGINKILSSLLLRGCKGFENFEFSDYLDSHGAELNLEIFEDGILISLKSLNEHFHKIFPLLELMINSPLLLNEQFQSVKKTTIDSLKKDKENPFNIAFEKWRKLVYFKHPYAYNPSGYEEDISSVTYNDILSEYENFKSRNKYLISNNEIINNKNTELFNNNCENNFENNFESTELDHNNLKRYTSTYQNSNQIILMLGNQTCSHSSKEYFPLKVLESYLSFGMSSELFKLFREKNGLTYDVGVFNPIRKQNSPFLIYLSVSNENAILAFRILIKLWRNLLTSLIAEKDINLAKVKLKSSLLISNQTLDEILQERIKLIGYGLDPDLHDKCLKKIENITSKDILKITNAYLSKPFLSIYGKKNICNEIYEIWGKSF